MQTLKVLRSLHIIWETEIKVEIWRWAEWARNPKRACVRWDLRHIKPDLHQCGLVSDDGPNTRTTPPAVTIVAQEETLHREEGRAECCRSTSSSLRYTMKNWRYVISFRREHWTCLNEPGATTGIAFYPEPGAVSDDGLISGRCSSWLFVYYPLYNNSITIL